VRRIRLTQAYQVINIPDFCNECGNCRTFCPTSGAPYVDKPHVHLSASSFEAHGEGFYMAGPGRMEIMQAGKKATLTAETHLYTFEDAELKLSLAKDTLEVQSIELKTEVASRNLREVAEAAILMNLLDGRSPFS